MCGIKVADCMPVLLADDALPQRLAQAQHEAVAMSVAELETELSNSTTEQARTAGGQAASRGG